METDWTGLGAVPGVGRVEVVESVGSTSTALLARVGDDPSGWPDGSVLVAEHQQAGRGRAGRTWDTPPGSALTLSMVLRPGIPVDRWGWTGLLGGVAVARALRDLGAPAVLKWPNDVLLPGRDPLPGWGTHRKVAGVLADLHPREPVVVLGVGVNVDQGGADLPVPWATSLRLAGHRAGREVLAVRLLTRWFEVVAAWRLAGGDARAAGLADAWLSWSTTLGAEVAVDLPGGGQLVGHAVALAGDGGLVVRTATGETTVRAGDVRLRTAGSGPAAQG